MADLYEQIERLDEENERLYKDLEAAQQALKDITGDARGLEAKAALVEELVAVLQGIIHMSQAMSGANKCDIRLAAEAAITKAAALLGNPCGKPSS